MDVVLDSKSSAAVEVIWPLRWPTQGYHHWRKILQIWCRGWLSLHILDHGLLVWLVFGRVCDVPVRQKLIAGIVVWGFSLVDDLDWQKISYKIATKHSCNLPFIICAGDVCSFQTLFLHSPHVWWHYLSSHLIPVYNQLRQDILHFYCYHYVLQNSSLRCRISATACLLLAVVSFHFKIHPL